MALFGAPRPAAALAAGLSVLAAGQAGWIHWHGSAPVAAGQPNDLGVLWFNLLAANATPTDRIVRAIADSPADLVVISEAAPLAGARDALGRIFPVVAGCESVEDCHLLVLSRRPEARVRLRRIGRTDETRMAVLRLPHPEGGRAVTVVAVHLFKPWFFGVSESEEWPPLDLLSRLDGPVVVIGDFNAAPWSRRLRRYTEDCGMALPHRLRATWPAGAGPLGLPIDHVMVREARLTAVAPWGAQLGSNHVGILARVSPGGAEPPPPVPASCAPETTTPLRTGRRPA